MWKKRFLPQRTSASAAQNLPAEESHSGEQLFSNETKIEGGQFDQMFPTFPNEVSQFISLHAL